MKKTRSKKPEVDPFSVQLQTWLDSDTPKTVAELEGVFKEKSFAMTFMVLMAIPALPLPTGGVSHIFELINMLVALELIAQRRTIWLPKRWRSKELGPKTQLVALPKLVKFISKIEKISRPRMSGHLDERFAATLFGIAVFILSLIAFLAPPFSGLDTMPSMGVVGISLGFILGDIVVIAVGLVIGIFGAVLSIGFGAVFIDFIKGLFE